MILALLRKQIFYCFFFFPINPIKVLQFGHKFRFFTSSILKLISFPMNNLDTNLRAFDSEFPFEISQNFPLKFILFIELKNMIFFLSFPLSLFSLPSLWFPRLPLFFFTFFYFLKLFNFMFCFMLLLREGKRVSYL